MFQLSIIVPIYNVEEYVERCIRSLEYQDISESSFEIICINDGSPDNSLEVVKRLCSEYKNIRLINQDNQGVSRARNNGIDRAEGRYLLFIDPDDYVEPDCLQRILKNAEQQNAQVSFLGFTVLDNESNRSEDILCNEYSSGAFTGIEAYFLSRGDGRTDPDRAWAVLFERNFINQYNLRFLPDVPYLEDGEFISRVLCMAERCIFDSGLFYNRTTRPGSATHSTLFHSEKALNGFLLAALSLKKFQSGTSLTHSQKEFLNQPICKFVVLVVASARKPFNLRRVREARMRLKKAGFGRLSLTAVNREFTQLGMCYNLSVYCLVLYQLFIDGIRSLRYRLRKFPGIKNAAFPAAENKI